MSNLVKSGVRSILSRTIRPLHLKIRPFFPARGQYPKLNGVVVYDEKTRYHWLDGLAPWHTGYREDNDSYEAEFIDAIEDATTSGDDVVIVGGGFGIPTIAAIKCVGKSGTVTTYEAAEHQVDCLKETISQVELSNEPDIYHRIVGEKVSTRGKVGAARLIPPEELPDCDILALDCEGAEVEILRELTIRPNFIVVETHANYDAPEDVVLSLLDDLGYEVLNRDPEIEERGIIIIMSRRFGDNES
jgi:hypothetical protein